MLKLHAQNIGGPPANNSVPDTPAWDRDGLNIPAAVSLKNIFLFLSLVFRYPGEAIFEEIRRLLPVFEDFFNAYAGDVPDLPEMEELQAEYVRLFVNNCGHVPAVPYASCHLDGGILMGESYFKLRQIMERTGFTLDVAAGELEDHLAILLEYGSVLTGRLIEDSTPGDSGFNEILVSLGEVTFQYLQPMMTPFWTNIAASAAFDFYGTAARALLNFMADAEAIYTQIFGASALEDFKTGVKT